MYSKSWNSVACQGHVAAVHLHLHSRRVEHERLADAYHVVTGRGDLCTAHHRAHPGDELPRAEGFGHVIIGAELEAGDPVCFLGASGQHDDRNIARAPDGARDVEAVGLRKGQVEDHEVGPASREFSERGRAGRRGHHLEPGPLQVVAYQPDDRRFVIDDENCLHERVIVGAKRGGDETPPRSRSGQTDCAVGVDVSASEAPRPAPEHPRPHAAP